MGYSNKWSCKGSIKCPITDSKTYSPTMKVEHLLLSLLKLCQTNRNTSAFSAWRVAYQFSSFTLIGLVLFGIEHIPAEVAAHSKKTFSRSGKVIYVKSGSAGNGKSWEKAFGNLHEALEAAKKNDQIWVSQGAYKPSEDGDRNVSFVLVEAVALFGGFAGMETKLEDRDPEQYKTILSGEIGTPDEADNSHTIVYGENLSSLTLVDGFIIRGGQSDGTTNETDKNKSTCGAAWFNFNASPTIRNCRFESNNAREGGAIYNLAGKNGNSSPIISNCIFVDNQADLDGGCLFNNGDEGTCKPKIENCKFENNIATYGSGIMNRARYGMTMVQVRACEFYKNKALTKGSVIYNHRDKTGICTTKLQDCIFNGNYTIEEPDVIDIYFGEPDIVGNE